MDENNPDRQWNDQRIIIELVTPADYNASVLTGDHREPIPILHMNQYGELPDDFDPNPQCLAVKRSEDDQREWDSCYIELAFVCQYDIIPKFGHGDDDYVIYITLEDGYETEVTVSVSTEVTTSL